MPKFFNLQRNATHSTQTTKPLLILLFICFSAFALTTNSQIIYTIAGNGIGAYSGDGGQATAAKISEPFDIAFDAAENLYFCDSPNARIRKISTSGIITTVVGNGTQGYSGDGGQATNASLRPGGITFDAAGNLYLADVWNNRVRKINTNGIITTIAGTGTQGFSGDGGQATAAEFYAPIELDFDAIGNLYIADWYNNRIRMINTSGIISTVAGTGASGQNVGSYGGDGGPATAAHLFNPIRVALDVVGNLYISDFKNNRIRMVNTSGIISTFAGTGTQGYSGDGGAATAAMLNTPSEITFDDAGNLFFSDEVNYRIRMVNTSGIISEVAGKGVPGYSGDGGMATAAGFYDAVGIAFDAAGNLYVADELDNRIRMISKPITVTVSVNSATVCAGSTTTLTASGASTYSWSTSATTASITPSPTVTTFYTVAATSTFTAFNTTAVSMGPATTTTVTVNALPTVTAASDSVTLCIGNTTTLTASGATSYTWSNSATTTTIAITPTVTTTYTLTGTDATDGCENTNTITQVVTNCTTGIQTYNQTGLNIFSYGNAIKTNGTIPQGTQLRVYNTLGQVVLTTALQNNIETNLPSGIYTIQVIDTMGSIIEIKKCVLINN